MKILVCGDINGDITELLKKVDGINKKAGPFDILLCSGSFFPNEPHENIDLLHSIKSGEFKFPIQTYILGPCCIEENKYFKSLPDTGIKLSDNLHYLGTHGVYSHIDGLKIAYFSGLYNKTQFRKLHRENSCYYTEFELNYLLDYCKKDMISGVDLFLSSDMPAKLTRFTGIQTHNLSLGSSSISLAALALKPRYHFSGHNTFFFERLPYYNNDITNHTPSHVTRFISLASLNTSSKTNKFIYAFNIDPLLNMNYSNLLMQPLGTTECPYIDITIDGIEINNEDYFFTLNQKNVNRREDDGSGPTCKKIKHYSNPSSRPNEKSSKKNLTDSCWFCLSSPDVEKHLVVSVQSFTYLALAKGALTSEHILLLPISHIAATNEAPHEVAVELDKYKFLIKDFFKSKGLSVVIYERNFKSNHLQIQIVPVSEHFTSNYLRETFLKNGHDAGFDFIELPSTSNISDLVNPGYPYVYVEFEEGPILLHSIKLKFDIHFPRRVLCSPQILNQPNSIDWKNCVLTKEKEIEYVKSFRNQFQKFEC